MAGGNLSPRQKMINLMYLVFIAMLALNMGKEVLQAFGILDENLKSSNDNLTAVNSGALSDLKNKASENAASYAEPARKAEQVTQISNSYYNYLDGLKAELEGTLEADQLTDYQVQDKSDYLDNKFFVGDNLSADGKAFIAKMNDYKSSMKNALGSGYSALNSEIDKKFDNSDVKDREGNMREYLDYNYKGFPLIASKTKMTLLQNEIKNLEAKVMGTLLQGKLTQIASMNNYEAIVVLDKSAYFNDETVTGKVVLGRYDDTTVPNSVVINGSAISQSSIKGGQIPINFAAGNVGDKTINGKMTFIEDGKTIEREIKGGYTVVGKPNSATISADKMNVVYRGVENPMTISFSGVDQGAVNASAPGLSKSGKGFVMRPGAGKDVTINVTAKLPNGQTVSDRKTFRIKNLPTPIGMVSGEYNDVKKSRSSLAISTISAEFLDFDFDLKPTVTGFIFKVPGKGGVQCAGNKLSAPAQGNLKTARKGDIVQFSKISASVPGVNLGSPSNIAVELTD